MRFLASLFAIALLAGCQTNSQHIFATPDKSWKTSVGQLKYSDAKRTLIGDVVVQQRGAQEFQLDFQKVGGIPLLTLREDATTVRAEGIFARGSWQGSPNTAPRHLRNWVALREAFQQPAKGATWVGQAKTLNGQIGTLSLTFPADEQRFVFQFNR
jgi:hypothetical protein